MTDPKIEALEKRLEALENQCFAQRLVIDEFEKKIEQLEKKVADNNLFSRQYQQIPVSPVSPAPSPCNHIWISWGSSGSYCTNCGAYSFTTTSTTLKVDK